MSRSLPSPVPPDLWSEVESRLEAAQVSDSLQVRGRGWSPAARFLALAASVLLVVGLGWTIPEIWQKGADRHALATSMGEYFSEFRRSPAAAQAALISAYDGAAVDAERAVEQVGYRPAVLRGLPAGYKVVSTHVLDMPCCRCVQSLCKSRDGTIFAVFEHAGEEEHALGNHAAVETVCHGKPCKLVELHDQLAASWRVGNRQLTVIGIRDVAELESLVASLDGSDT